MVREKFQYTVSKVDMFCPAQVIIVISISPLFANTHSKHVYDKHVYDKRN